MNDLEVLNEINKGALIGMESIKNIYDKVEDDKLRQVVEDQYSEYEAISNQVKDKYDVSRIENISSGMKLMNKTGIIFNTMRQDADLILQTIGMYLTT